MRIILVLLFFLPIYSSGQEHALKIEVYLKGMPDNTLFYLNEEKKNIDSSFSKNEILYFTILKKTDSPLGIFLISKDKKLGYVIWVENESIKLQGIYNDLSPLTTNNSKTQNEFREYLLLTTNIKDSINISKRKFDSLRFNRNSDSSIFQLKHLKLSTSLKQINIDFIKKYPNSVISAQNLFIEATNKRLSKEEVFRYFKILSPEQQNSSIGRGILKSVLLYKNPTIGEKAPDFTLKDSEGKNVSLSDYKGKNIVLLFWASWCGPCIKEMPEIIKFYENNRGLNLVFLTVSLDERKESWLTAIQKHSLPFINISDLKGWMNEAAMIYGVSGIPDNFLIDSNGILLVRERGFNMIKKSILENIK